MHTNPASRLCSSCVAAMHTVVCRFARVRTAAARNRAAGDTQRNGRGAAAARVAAAQIDITTNARGY